MIKRPIIRILCAFFLFAISAIFTSKTLATYPVLQRAAAVEESSYSLQPFGQVHAYRPSGNPRGVVLFLSDEQGWSAKSAEMARVLAQDNLLVAGISTPALLHSLEHSGQCVDPNYPLIDLARDIQHRMHLPSYMKPIIVGYGSGATLAYASIAQWQNAGYQGVVSMAFTPRITGQKNWCKAPGFSIQRMTKPASGWRFISAKQITLPWTVIQGHDDKRFDSQSTLQFVANVPNAKLIQIPDTTHVFGDSSRWSNPLRSAVAALLPPPPPVAAPGQLPIPNMPITIVPATKAGPQDVMAVIYSGDGGWVGIDRDVAGQLAGVGIPVVGIDSLSYFWTARTPSGAGRDLSQVIHAFSQRWNRPRILLIGYSFGADTLPYMVNNLDIDTRRKIVSLSLLGLSSSADFQFHLSSWLNLSSDDALPTIPAISRLRGMTIRCVRGATESDSACPSIPNGIAQQYLVPGDHHFNRNSALLARIILGQRQPGTVNK